MKYQSTRMDESYSYSVWRQLARQLWRFEMREAPVIDKDSIIRDAIASKEMQSFLKHVVHKAQISLTQSDYHLAMHLPNDAEFHGMPTVTLKVLSNASVPLPLHPEWQDNGAANMVLDYVRHGERANQTLNHLRNTYQYCVDTAFDYEHLRLMLTTVVTVWQAAGHKYPEQCRDPAQFNSKRSSIVSPHMRQHITSFDDYFLKLSFILQGRMEMPSLKTTERVKLGYDWE